MKKKEDKKDITTPYKGIKPFQACGVMTVEKPLKPTKRAVENIIQAFIPQKDFRLDTDRGEDMPISFILEKGRSLVGCVRFNQSSRYYQVVLSNGKDYKDDYTYLEPMDFGDVVIYPSYWKITTIEQLDEIVKALNSTLRQIKKVNVGLFLYSIGGMKMVLQYANKNERKKVITSDEYVELSKEDTEEYIFDGCEHKGYDEVDEPEGEETDD